jgi:hypothetical protein
MAILGRVERGKARTTQNAARKAMRGAETPMRIGSGGAPGGLTNAPPAPRRTTSASQMASPTATTNVTLGWVPVD